MHARPAPAVGRSDVRQCPRNRRKNQKRNICGERRYEGDEGQAQRGRDVKPSGSRQDSSNNRREEMRRREHTSNGKRRTRTRSGEYVYRQRKVGWSAVRLRRETRILAKTHLCTRRIAAVFVSLPMFLAGGTEHEESDTGQRHTVFCSLLASSGVCCLRRARQQLRC